ncbi:paired amphipathic helix containing protein [Reticulomyxa filosa]|uniref:Paired amphipathic helix containing protein n=1 Tax=Reticulomyxa filosa TaxID=46433 RepID=X6N0C9_RETFI|nr:paired amphipathic helix containing protein [Reticulomyxa filosa]|eukprot:ETO19511.1 paired amphipathic helix containing protein [Reticulomyxa filosa]
MRKQLSNFLKNNGAFRSSGSSGSSGNVPAAGCHGLGSAWSASASTSSHGNGSVGINANVAVNSNGLISANGSSATIASGINSNSNNNNNNNTFVSNPPLCINGICPAGQAAILAQSALAAGSGRVLFHISQNTSETFANASPHSNNLSLSVPTRPAAKRMRLNDGSAFALSSPCESATVTDYHKHARSCNTNETDAERTVSVKSRKMGLCLFDCLETKLSRSLFDQVLEEGHLYGLDQCDFNTMIDNICNLLSKESLEAVSKEVRSQLNKQSPGMYAYREMEKDFYEYTTNPNLLRQLEKVLCMCALRKKKKKKKKKGKHVLNLFILTINSTKQKQASYRKLPDFVVQPRCSGRTPLVDQVLNHWFVSKPIGHEGPGNEHNGVQLKNRYKDELLQNEEDMFELDLMIETNRAARRKLEHLFHSHISNVRLNGVIHLCLFYCK